MKTESPTESGAANDWAIRDEFRGGNALLRDCIKALINLNDDNALVPHGIGGHARNLLAACYHRLPNATSSATPPCTFHN